VGRDHELITCHSGETRCVGSAERMETAGIIGCCCNHRGQKLGASVKCPNEFRG
jgi:hypothetical protein